ncbi:protein of unknown function [Xenorhabdus doucetiae]|uniref:Uncharacterized protein n=1 Tax=Xenorhabdus doucetiae TaxID=351671 RepID=A0A068QRB7_9GAMM|nr:protein of unknown function [Xenorhabdus doucetiae]
MAGENKFSLFMIYPSWLNKCGDVMNISDNLFIGDVIAPVWLINICQ